MKQSQGLTAEMYQAIVAIMDDRLEATRVTRRDYDRLADGQDRIESRMDRIEAALERLAEAQARTEERVGRLEEGQEALRAAMKDLAEAQARTDRSVGALADVIGYGLEDVARLLLPPYLEKHYGIVLRGAPAEELQPRFFPVEDELPLEIDLYGEGQRNGRNVVVLGESKSRIGGGVVKDFVNVLEQVEPFVEGEVWRVMFGYYIHPSAREVAEEYDVVLMASYQR